MFNFFKQKKNQVPEEAEFADLILIAESIVTEQDKTTIKAMVTGKEMGLEVVIQDTTSKVIFSENNPPEITAAKNGVIFRSLGKISDDFLVFLSELYKFPNQSLKMINEISFTSICMEGDPSQLANQPLRFKLFFDKEFTNPESKEAESFYDNEYFEIFLHIDLPNKRIELNEKDIDYRKALLFSLQAKE